MELRFEIELDILEDALCRACAELLWSGRCGRAKWTRLDGPVSLHNSSLG